MIILVVAYAFYTLGTGKSSTLFVELTDPAYLPKGTSSLFINYDSVQAHITNASGSAWIESQENGLVNLLSLSNISRVVAKLEVASNSTVDMVRFNITSANITVNGTSYPLILTSRKLTTNVSQGSVHNYASLLVSLSPTVIVLYTDNESLFVMVPSLRGILLPAKSGLYVGSDIGINSSSTESLSASSPNISIDGASMVSQGNQTSISLKVSDKSKLPITIRNVILLGNESLYVTIGKLQTNVPPIYSINNITSSSLLNGTFSILGNVLSQLGSGASGINANVFSSINISELAKLGSAFGISANQISGIEAGGLLNGSIQGVSSLNNLNASAKASLLKNVLANLSGSAQGLQSENISQIEAKIKARIISGNLSSANLTNIINLLVKAQAEAQAGYAQNIKLEQMNLGSLDFFVTSNSGLVLPSSAANLSSSAYGYTMQPGATSTLAFNGRLSLAGGRIAVSLINGDTYKIEVIGDSGAYASLNVTAG